jgi:hypothetical protein
MTESYLFLILLQFGLSLLGSLELQFFIGGNANSERIFCTCLNLSSAFFGLISSCGLQMTLLKPKGIK